MKKYLIAIGFMMLVSIISNASNEAYENMMKKEIHKLGEAKTPEDYQKSANTFARIAEMNLDEWLPDYYAGLAYTNMAFKTEGSIDQKDALFSQAKKHAEKAAAISPSNSEIVALQGYITLGELSADPNSRGQSLSPVVMQTFGKAIDLNRQNPRAIFLMAQMEYGMAQFFGQGPEKACGLIDASIQLFEKEASQANEETLAPTWGKEMALKMKGICEQ